MESSSDESFLWADTSNDSSDNEKIDSRIVKTMENNDTDTSTNYKQKSRQNVASESELKKKKSKKRRCSEVVEDNSDYSHPEKKRIKLEPESDIDAEKKKKSKKDKTIQESFLFDEEYLNLRVKEEQTSLVKSEKKKKKKEKSSNSLVENASESECSTNKENYLDFRVKQEEASVVENEVVKSKKKKKHKRSTESSDKDILSEAKSTVSEDAIPDESTEHEEPTKYSIVDEKFSAEETVVEKPRKKKRKTETDPYNNINDDNNSLYSQKNAVITPDNDNFNNISLGPNDFSCNNIVSSTIINTSVIESNYIKESKTKELVKKSKKTQPVKISDRIRFEEDDSSSQQDHQLDKTSDKINRYLKANPHLKPYVRETSNDRLITKDDEIFVLTWPHKINVEKLKNITISSENKCKLKIDGTTYEGTVNQDVNTITLLTHENMQEIIKNIPVTECIDYHKKIPKVQIPDHNIMVDNQRNFTPLPETKCRHPLFGTHYKKAIKISPAVAERLQAAKEHAEHSETPSESHKKKKHKKHKHKSADIKTEESVNIKVEHETLKKNKKRKGSQENDADGPPKKMKRVKQNVDSPAVWESEKAIEENLFNF